MENVKAYSSDSVSLIETNYLPYGEFSYDHYHFIAPVSEMPAVLTENKLISIKTGAMFPCNPGQHHRALESRNIGGTYYSLDLSKELIRSTAAALFRSADLEFEISSFTYSPDLNTLINSFQEEYKYKQAGYELVLQTLSIQIAVALLRSGSHNLSVETSRQKEYYEKKLVERVKEFMQENLNGAMTLEKLAHELNYREIRRLS
jgi:hypothetical protein